MLTKDIPNKTLSLYKNSSMELNLHFITLCKAGFPPINYRLYIIGTPQWKQSRDTEMEAPGHSVTSCSM